VQVRPQGIGVNWRQVPPAAEQLLSCQPGLAKRSQFGNRPTTAGDHEVLARGNALNNVSAMVAQLSDRDFGHARSVSHVIRA
jgi:hypothetical protein